METRDRRAQLLHSSRLNGIDFVEIADQSQTRLRVHFINGVPLRGTLSRLPAISGGKTIATVAVAPIDDASDWGSYDGHLTLTLRVAAPGDFSIYTLSIPSPVLDSFFDHVQFSFKALCPSDLDCAYEEPPCPPPAGNPPPIDYLAKDFLSFRKALLDFSALRYPQWQERSEADFGMMFLEALAATADDLSYTQDRIAAEATLETATQRRSAVRHARLVDYEPRPATAAATMLQMDVGPGVTAIREGLPVIAAAPDGTPIVFETGTSLRGRLIDPATGLPRPKPPGWPASRLWNRGQIRPYWFDDSRRCLEAGATEMYVLGHGFDFQPGQLLVIETEAESSADPPIRQIVRLLDAGWAVEECDLLFTRPPDPPGAEPPYLACVVSPPAAAAPTAVTRIRWRTQDALTADRDLTRTSLAGNLIPATHGATVSAESFFITVAPAGDLITPASVDRTGARPTQAGGEPGEPVPMHLYTLAKGPVAWLAQESAASPPVPEIVMRRMGPGEQQYWQWFRWLLDADRFDNAFTLDAARWRQLTRNSDNSLQYDYDGDEGDTIRFGDGSFGLVPNDGDLFAATYRVGGGAAGNVAADTITRIDPALAAGEGIVAVTNPIAAAGGADAEDLQTVRRLAPQAFRARQFRAVIEPDYEAAAQTLPWVQRAGTAFRWTGSWLTVFSAADRLAGEQVSTDQRVELAELLNRYRMAGYESYVPDARYLSLDLLIYVCARPDAFRGDVETGITAALSAASPAGFFNLDRFTFGQALERSALEAAVQNAPGVAGVIAISYRARARSAAMRDMPDRVMVGSDQIIRCDNDPSVPEYGSFAIRVEGGK